MGDMPESVAPFTPQTSFPDVDELPPASTYAASVTLYAGGSERMREDSGANSVDNDESAIETDSELENDAGVSFHVPEATLMPKANSTSSIFARSSLYAPDIDEVILCVATVLQLQMMQDLDADDSRKGQFRFFDDDQFDAGRARSSSSPNSSAHEELPNAPESIDDEDIEQARRRKRQRRDLPYLEYIYKFTKAIFDCAQFSAECNVISLIFINRLVALTGIPLHADNWRPILLTSLLISQKVWDDRSLGNVHFARICPMFTVREINMLEKKFLELIQYDVSISSRLYAKYYFELRSVSEASSNRPFNLRPLNAAGARQLEFKSMVSTREHRAQTRQNRHQSCKYF